MNLEKVLQLHTINFPDKFCHFFPHISFEKSFEEMCFLSIKWNKICYNFHQNKKKKPQIFNISNLMENKGEKKTPRKKEIFLKNSTTNLCCHYWISGYGFLFFIIYFWLLLQSKKVDPFGTFIHSFIQSSVSCPFFWQKCFRHIQRPFFCLLHTIFLIQNCVFFSLLFFLQTKFLKNCYHSKKKLFNFSSNNIVSDFFFDFNFVFSIFVIQSSLVLQSVFCFPIGSCKLNFVSSHSFFVGVAIQRLFCFVLFCFVVFWGWVFKKRECFGFCRVVFFFFSSDSCESFFCFVFVFSV